MLDAQYRILSDWVPDVSSDDSRPSEPGWFDSDSEAKEKMAQMEKWEAARESDLGIRREYWMVQAASIAALMTNFILHMLYKLLGTVAYILRSPSAEIRMVVLAESSIINYFVRLPLGMLAGIAVGWLMGSETLPTGLVSIQPLALAFIAGYSVELVFTAMDNVIAAFAGERKLAGAK